jgi:HK97 family phage major capsid protein
MVPSLLDRLREQRDNARRSADEILTRAADEGRDLTTSEFQDHADRLRQEREASDEIERHTAAQIADLRAGQARNGRPVISRENAEIARAFRSAINAKNPQPIDIGCEMRDEWPDDFPDVQGRTGKIKIHTRDTLKTTATQALSTDVYSQIVMHLVETSSLMAAGATVVTTATGESLIIPKSTGFVSSAITAEGASITESDPTLATVTLGAHKYASFFEISRELADDTPTNLLSFLAQQAALSLGLSATGYGDDLINGTGSGQPRGLLLDAGTGVTGPAGTGTSLGSQGTANQGTDALWNLVGSVAEPYASSSTSGFLLRNASDIIVRKLRDTTGQPVQGLGTRGTILGYPNYLDPFMPAMANGAESIAFGDFSTYFIRIVNGIRFERSTDFHFQDDLVSFRCILRLDGALVDTGSVKTFVNTT